VMKSFILALLTALTLWGDAHIFVYHRFGDAKHASTNTSIAQLREHFEYFKSNGYKVVSLEQLQLALSQHQEIPDNWVVLTIDDAYRSFYKNALEVFKEYDYPFTLFVYVEATQKGYHDFMTWKQLKEASHYGEVALHSYAHPYLVKLSPEEVHADTKHAYELFTRHMGYKPLYYAYPYGEYTDETRHVLETFGFKLILNQNSGAINSKSDPFNIDRCALTGNVNLRSKLAMKALNAEWITPKKYPKSGNLKSIHAKIAPTIKKAEYYVSGYGWKHITVNNGDINISFDKPLKFARSRIFLKNGPEQSSIILVKE
jgi:poly-beta-1,6-N-acetyl-D-glucosamine N-deacetylase